MTDLHREWGSATAVGERSANGCSESGLTVSVGVGPNKLVAKIASDADKPDGLTVVPPARVEAFLDPLSRASHARSRPGDREALWAA